MGSKPHQKITRTKTVATVGPASSTVEVLSDLIVAGVNVFRLNMAHGTRENHEKAIKRIREASKKVDLPVGILIDLAGPKIRLGQLFEDPMTVENGQDVTFVRGSKSSSKFELTCTYESLLDELKVGDAVVLADGLIRLTVTQLDKDKATCNVVDGGTFRSRQGVNLPATNLSIPALGEKDIDNAKWATTQDVQFVSLSCVRNADEINQRRKLFLDHNCNAYIVANNEKQEAMDNLEEIVQATDAIMVARGDLGVEIAIEKTPLAQKQIIKVCCTYRKPVIVATQMLESMHHSKQPTRAEASDVANAILDGADACMLSGETAIGEYPLDAVGMMNRIMLETETIFKGQDSHTTLLDDLPHNDVAESIAFGAAQIAKRLDSKLVVIASSTGETARLKSKQRDYIPTLCLTDDDQVAKKLSLYWGIIAVVVPNLSDQNALQTFIKDWAKSQQVADSGDSVVVVSDTEMMPGVHDAILVSKI